MAKAFSANNSNGLISQENSTQAASILVVGAGLAGLTVAHRLRQAGVMADVIEAAGRVGGRVESVPNALGTSLTAELGAEFIDSNHCCLRSLTAELNLTLLDRQDLDLPETTLFFAGQKVSEAAIAQDFAAIAPLLERDIERIKGFRTYRSHCPAATALDQLSLSQYLDNLPISKPLRQLIEIAYSIEFGQEATAQSCLNLLYLIGIRPELELLGTCDERFYVAGGNEQVVSRLAALLDGQIETNCALVALSRRADGQYRAVMQSGLGIQERCYERVVLTVPFSVLRSLDLHLDLPLAKRHAIDCLGYSDNHKLTTAYRQRVWQGQQRTAHSFTDLAFQNTWESDLASRDPSGAGLLTTFMGGEAARELSACLPQGQVEKLRSQWEQVFPGLAAAELPGGLSRSWLCDPYSQGAYACYLVGQWTAFYGAERERVENLFFAGEHCSVDFQACMEGACQTGEQAALEILQDLRRVPMTYSLQQRYGSAFSQGGEPLPFG
jgi:monoamine oxidase